MRLHVKVSIEVKERDIDHPLDTPINNKLEVWSDGVPGADIQLKIGKRLYLLPADELIDAVERASKRNLVK